MSAPAAAALTPLPATLRLGAVELTVADIGRSVAWWEQAIGLTVLERDNGRAALGARDGGTTPHVVQDHAHVTPSLSANATSAASKQPSGARTMPAPTWPTPGSRCAMPVLIVGAKPVSTTSRMSMPVGTPV